MTASMTRATSGTILVVDAAPDGATELRPLQGLTVLVVEDSRFASQALRLLCLRSGARIRRADSLASARRHLATYRPGVAIVDLGLPDGPGAALIGELAHARPRIAVVLGLSARPEARQQALAAGADGFLEKPILSLARFQQAILSHLPAPGPGPRAISGRQVDPDPAAFAEDLAFARGLLDEGEALSWREGASLDYLTRFLAGVAVQAGDGPLASAAEGVQLARARGRPLTAKLRRLDSLVQQRLAERRAG